MQTFLMFCHPCHRQIILLFAITTYKIIHRSLCPTTFSSCPLLIFSEPAKRTSPNTQQS